MLQENDALPRATAMSALPAKNYTTNFFRYKLGGRLTESNKALLFFSGKETIQNFNGSN